MTDVSKFDFECGDCAALAVALHRATGLPIFAVVDYDDVLDQNVLVHAYVKIDNAEYPVFDIRGPGDLPFVLSRFPNSGAALEVAIGEAELLAMAYSPSNMPDIDAVMPYVRKLLDVWQEELGEVLPMKTEREANSSDWLDAHQGAAQQHRAMRP